MDRPTLTSAVLAFLLITSAAVADDPTTAPATTQPAGGTLQGIVLNLIGGGVLDAKVRIESPKADPGAAPLAEGTTNRTGDFELAMPKLAGIDRLRVRVQKSGYAEFVSEVEIEPDADLPFIDVTLEGTSTISGEVRAFDTNAPVPKVSIECESAGRQMRTLTDEKGRYTIENLSTGPAIVTAMAEGCGIERKQVDIGSEQVRLFFEVRPERLIDLTVTTDQGDPGAGVAVEVLTEPQQLLLYATTDDKGKAALHGIAADSEKVSFRLNGEKYVHMPEFGEPFELPKPRVATKEQDNKRPPIKHALTVTRSAMIQGTVVDRVSGKPVLGVRVIAGREQYGSAPMIWTSSDGTYELAGLPPGKNVISFQHDDHATLISEVDLTAGKTATLDAALESGETLGGQVVDDKGQQIEGVWVTAESWKGYSTLGMRTVTDEKGRFSFAHAPPGQIAVSFAKPGYGQPVSFTLATGKSDYRLEMKKAAPSPGRPQRGGPAPAAARGGNLKIGDKVPELTMKATDGREYKLSALKGKYVFIDCWASWCGPCMGEVPNVKALHHALRTRNDFVMIGVNLDRDRAAFDRTVKKNEMNWVHVTGPDSGAEKVFETLGGFGIPYTCLIGPDGKLIARGLRGEGLAEEVKKHLSK